jgi:hypothetical protein
VSNRDISRAAALLTNTVPASELLAWATAMGAAQTIEDVPAEWRERIREAHRERMRQAETPPPNTDRHP